MLNDYETGVNLSTANTFSTVTYKPIYEHHLNTLREFKKRTSRAVPRLQEDLYNLAR